MSDILEYKIVREKRKTIAIFIEDGIVKIKAPFKVGKETIDAFILSKLDWIMKNIKAYQDQRDKHNNLREFFSVMLNGNPINIEFVPDSIHTKLKNGTLYISQKYKDDKEVLCAKIGRLYKRIATEKLEQRLRYWSNIMGLVYREYYLTSAKRKWGSCTTTQIIALNYRLVMLDPIIQDYVIIHELCHLAYPDHSDNFWNLVSRFCPSYKERRKELKQWNDINDIY